jgi:hypothetical protein
MIAQNDYTEALNTCIDRLHEGDDLERILSDYPEMAAQLRPMLEAGQAIRRIQYSPVEVQQAQQRIDPAFQQVLRNSSGGGFGWISGLLLVVIVTAAIWLTGGNFSDDMTAIEATATALPTATATIQPTPSTAADASDSIVIIEGPVSDAGKNRLTIYDTVITVDDARVRGIQPGDVLYVEAKQTGQVLQAVDFQLRGVQLLVSDSGEIWRDDDCSNPPPAWVSGGVARWQQRCLASGTQSRGRGGSASGASQSD